MLPFSAVTSAFTLVLFILLFLKTTAQINYAGYITATNVTQHGRIDLDQAEMETNCDAFEFAAALNIFENGKHSQKSLGLRTLAGFSTSAATRMAGQTNFILFRNYYNNDRYCYDYVVQALQKQGPFKNVPDVTASECANKGSQYQCVLMYIIFEMEDAIADCQRGTPADNDNAVNAWDEAVAFYVGSLVGNLQASGNEGKLMFGLANKRCSAFGTCNTANDVNNNVMRLFNEGKTAVQSGNCASLISIKDQIVNWMKIPVLQGMLRYAYKGDPGSGSGSESDKSTAEGNAFMRAVVPWIHASDPSAASFIFANMPITGVVTNYREIFSKTYAALPGMGLSAEMLGEYTEEGANVNGGSNGGGGLSAGEIAGIVIGSLAGLAIIVFGAYYFAHKKNASDKWTKNMVPDIEGVKHTGSSQSSDDAIPQE